MCILLYVANSAISKEREGAEWVASEEAFEGKEPLST